MPDKSPGKKIAGARGIQKLGKKRVKEFFVLGTIGGKHQERKGTGECGF